jgi:serine/threonine-protein kinase
MKSARLSGVVLRVAVWVLVGCEVIWMPMLPERVATHFDGAGRANGWMSREGHLWGSMAVHLGVSGFIVGLCAVMHRLPPGLMNLPNKDYWGTPERYPEACAVMRVWSRWLAAAMLVWWAAMDWQIVLANQGGAARLNMTAVGVLTGCFLAVVMGAVVWLLLRFLRRPGVT